MRYLKTILTICVCLILSVSVVWADQSGDELAPSLTKEEYVKNLLEPEVIDEMVQMYSSRTGSDDIRFEETRRDLIFLTDGSINNMVIYDVFAGDEFIESYGALYSVSPPDPKRVQDVQYSTLYEDEAVGQVMDILDEHFPTPEYTPAAEIDPTPSPLEKSKNPVILIIAAFVVAASVLSASVIFLKKKKTK